MLDTPLISLLNKSLDGLWKREQVISDNLANYETPGYKRKYVSFEDSLRQALQSSSTPSSALRNLSEVEPTVHTASDETLRLDGNNVDVEKENLEMLRNQYQYQYTQRLLNDSFARLRAAISEGRK